MVCSRSTRSLRLGLHVGGTVALALVAAACSMISEEAIHVDGPTYVYLDEVFAAADGVAEVEVGRLFDNHRDTGGPGASGPGIWMNYYEVEVIDPLGSDLPDEIVLVWLDVEREGAHDVRPLEEGGRYVMALEHLPEDVAPGGLHFDNRYGVIAAEYGVVEIDADGTATAWGEQVLGLVSEPEDYDIDTATSEPWPLDTVADVAHQVNGDR